MEQNEMSVSARRIQLLEILREEKEVTVADLSERFGVVPMTIRRDLHYYEQQGIAETFYGGARLKTAAAPFADFTRRSDDHGQEKQRLAKRAAQEVKEGDIIFLDVSTTVYPMLDYLSDLSFTAVTNSLPVLVHLSQFPKIRVIAAPGLYQETYGGLLDLSTIEFLQKYHFQKAFFGASSCDPAFGISCDEEIEAAIKRTVLERSDYSAFLIGSEKMNRHRFVKICDAGRPDMIITNSDLSQTLQETYRNAGAKLEICF